MDIAVVSIEIRVDVSKASLQKLELQSFDEKRSSNFLQVHRAHMHTVRQRTFGEPAASLHPQQDILVSNRCSTAAPASRM